MNENEIVDEMTENEENIISCMTLHAYHDLEEIISEYFISEENMFTVRGKYWNRSWITNEGYTDEEVNKISQYYYIHCLMSH